MAVLLPCSVDLFEKISVNIVTNTSGLNCITTGLGTTEQRDKARELGCGACQGYLCSRPVPPREVAPLLRQYGVEA